jgi:cyclic peptide transporter
MGYLNSLFPRSRLFHLVIICLSIIKSLLSIALLLVINFIVANKSEAVRDRWILYTSFFAISFLTLRALQSYFIKLTTKAHMDLQIGMIEKLSEAQFEDVERFGNEKIFTAMYDINTLGTLLEAALDTVSALIVMTAAFVYLSTVSLLGTLVIMVAVAILTAIYLIRNRTIARDLGKLRDLEDDHYRYLEDLLHGFRELKMNGGMNDKLKEQFLKKNRMQANMLKVKTSSAYMNNELIATHSWYVIFGIIIFALPLLFNLPFELLSSFLITLLYLVGPVNSAIAVIPLYTNIKISAERLKNFNTTLEGIRRPKASALSFHEQDFNEIELKDVVYKYGAVSEPFVVGPLNLTIRKGEVIFVVGGNGSGKSTFVNLLSGLYSPTSGTILFNGCPVNDDNRQSYRDKMSAIFTKNHLFSENYTPHNISKQNLVLRDHISEMKLGHAIHFDETRNIILRQLSVGQSKRLAMIYLMLDNRHIMILDEWAAEQDSGFRDYFYEDIIERQKKYGKTIIMITHDYEYFHLSSRLIKFKHGLITSDQPSSSQKESTAGEIGSEYAHL